MYKDNGYKIAVRKSRLASRHPWQLDCHVPVADGLYLRTAIPYPHYCSRPMRIGLCGDK